MRDSLWLCASRGRPGNAADLRENWYPVTVDAELLIAVDSDDPDLDRYVADGPVEVMTGLPPGLGPVLNTLADRYAPLYKHIGFLGDDHRPRTPGWDRALVDALGGKPGVAYGDDLFQGENIPTAALISSPLLLGLGYMVPPGVIHLEMDNFWKTLGRATTLAWCPGVIIEHMHPSAGKAPWDDGYARVNSVESYSRDGLAYEQFLHNRWAADLDRLKDYLACNP